MSDKSIYRLLGLASIHYQEKDAKMPNHHKLRGIPATPVRFQALYGPPVVFLFGWGEYVGVL